MISNQRVVVITGCSSGFGYLTALKFAREHCLVYAGVRDPESYGAMELKNTAAKENLDLRLIKIDVTDDRSVTEAVGIVKQAAGRVDILVNNAGFGYLGPVETFSINEVKAQFETNVFGLLRMVKAVVPLMREATAQRSAVAKSLKDVHPFEDATKSDLANTSHGDCRVAGAPRNDEVGMDISPASPKVCSAPLIVNLSSINGLVPFPLFAVYSASKHAVEALSEGLRFELAPFGIRVVLIEPGSFLTKFTDNRRHPAAMAAANNPYRKLIDSFMRRYERMNLWLRPTSALGSVIARLTDTDEAIPMEKDPSTSLRMTAAVRLPRRGLLAMTEKAGLLAMTGKITAPQKVADLIFKIAQVENPRLRYRIGADAHLYYWLHRLLPAWVWEWLLRRVYRW